MNPDKMAFEQRFDSRPTCMRLAVSYDSMGANGEPEETIDIEARGEIEHEPMGVTVSRADLDWLIAALNAIRAATM